jgi:hypothetical protein
MTIEGFFVWLKTEGRVIWDAPYVFGIAAVLIAWGTWKAAKAFYAQAVDNAKGKQEIAEKHRDLYETEAKNAEKRAQTAQKELEKVKQPSPLPSIPAQLAPVMNGNAAVQAAFVSVTTSPIREVQVTTAEPSKWVAYQRLREAGLLEVSQETPQYIIATGTSAASKLRQKFDELNQSLNKDKE